MKAELFSTNYIIRISFKNLKKPIDYYVEKDEWERFRTRMHFCTMNNTLEVLEQVDSSFVCINVQNVVHASFIFDENGKSYEVPSEKENNENWSIKIQFVNDQRANSVFIKDHNEIGELYMKISDEQTDMEMQEASRFLGFTDGEGELQMFSRSEVLYLMIPRMLFESGAGDKKREKGRS